MDGALEPQEDLLSCQQSWTSYFFGPETASTVYFLFKGLPHPPQEPFDACERPRPRPVLMMCWAKPT